MNLFRYVRPHFRVFLLLLSFQIAAYSAPRIYFQEDFRNYKNYIPGIPDNRGITYYNEIVFAQLSAVNVDLEQSSYLFDSFRPMQGFPARIAECDISFRFSLKRGDSRFALVLARDNGSEVFVDISRESVTVRDSKGEFLADQKAPFDIRANVWHRAVIKIGEGKLVVYIDDFSDMKEILKVEFPTSDAFIKGINFSGYRKMPFSITDIVCSDPAPLPENPLNYYLNKPEKREFILQGESTFSVPANDIFGALLKINDENGKVKAILEWSDDTRHILSFKSTSTREIEQVTEEGKRKYSEVRRPDAIIYIEGIGEPGKDGAGKALAYYIRPNLYRYKSNLVNYRSYTAPAYVDAMYGNIIHHWDQLPKASEHVLKVEFRKTSRGVDVFLDGKYADTVSGQELRNVKFESADGATVGGSFSYKSTFESQKYLPLDVSSQGMSHSFADASISLEPELQVVQDVPFWVNSGENSADVGLVNYAQGNWLLEPDEFLARSPFDGYLSEIHFGVPGDAPYTAAWVLAAVDPDPSKDPILTTRLTKYHGLGVGKNVIADTETSFPRGNEASDQNIRKVGTVTVNQKGESREVPLFLVKIPLQSGKIIDKFDGSRINLEFLGKTGENFQQIDKSTQPDPGSTSSVQLFGVTLEKSPVSMSIVQIQTGNIFANGEKPETVISLKSTASTAGTVSWKIEDGDGKTVAEDSQKYLLKGTNGEQKVLLPLNVEQNGWYRLLISVLGENDELLLSHTASFAMLGKDIRKAGYDSPFGASAWGSSYNFPGAEDVMYKAGIRNFAWAKRTEEDLKKWQITNPQILVRVNLGDARDLNKLREKVQRSIDASLLKFPHAKEVLLFHASGPGTHIAPELLGQRVDKTESQVLYAKVLNSVGELIKEKYPHLTLVIGDHGSRIADMLRGGGGAEHLTIANESTSLAIMPEKLHEYSPQSMLLTRDAARVLTGKNVPVSGTLSYTNRATRDTGEERQAQWYARDMLLGLVHGFKIISPSTFIDPSAAYYNTWQGNSGIVGREPFVYPKKAYVAYATLTNQLDQVTFKRQIPTGSHSVYAVEFSRQDGAYSAALWAARGFVDFHISFAKSTSIKIVDMYGREKTVNTAEGSIVVNAGERPVYLLSDAEIQSILLQNRTFPEDSERAEKSIPVVALDELEEIELRADETLKSTFADSPRFPLRLPGEFEIEQVDDNEKGTALELRLDTTSSLKGSRYIAEYTTLRFKNPPVIKGNPAGIGVWIKGNSSWGRVIFEVEDTSGEVWKSSSTSGFGVDNLDWPGYATVNYDGWNFVSIPLRQTELFRGQSAGPVSAQWVSGGGDKNRDFPLKLRALSIEMNRETLDLLEFKQNEPVIRLKDIRAVYDQGDF